MPDKRLTEGWSINVGQGCDGGNKVGIDMFQNTDDHPVTIKASKADTYLKAHPREIHCDSPRFSVYLAVLYFARQYLSNHVVAGQRQTTAHRAGEEEQPYRIRAETASSYSRRL